MTDETPQADAYYSEEAMDNEEIDLSFLNDNDDKKDDAPGPGSAK